MKLTREEALKLHRQMWTDMQDALGDNPSRDARWTYKNDWIEKHFPDEEVQNDCFLCEYCCGHQFSNCDDFDYDFCECLIKWPDGRCEDSADNAWYNMPISELLALPERDDEADEEVEEEPADMKDGLYLCDLRYSAEGDCTGYMYLTEQEYETVKKVVNTCNWNNARMMAMLDVYLSIVRSWRRRFIARSWRSWRRSNGSKDISSKIPPQDMG